VIIGAILTQNVSWLNVKKAITNLKTANLLDAHRLHKSDVTEIARQIISSRYYNMKAQKIKNFLDFFFDEYDGDLLRMSNEEMMPLRKKLLRIKGLGEETVDSILLYACNKPIFVVDAYTKRIFSRYGILDENASYGVIQSYFMDNLPEDIDLYNDFHAQIVQLGNLICKQHPECDKCPIKRIDKNIECDYAGHRDV
jgi:endonuclease-3 related protein